VSVYRPKISSIPESELIIFQESSKRSVAVGEVSGPCCGLIYSINVQTDHLTSSRHLTLDENGTAVSMDRRCASFRPLIGSYHSKRIFLSFFFFFESRSRRDVQDEDEDDEDEEEDDEEDEEEDEGEEEGLDEPEVTRAERRELKKKQAAEGASKAQDEKQDNGADGDEGGDEDALFANPNHVTKKLNISDLSAPRQLTRRERCVPHALLL
jgi:hypothetical protein